MLGLISILGSDWKPPLPVCDTDLCFRPDRESCRVDAVRQSLSLKLYHLNTKRQTNVFPGPQERLRSYDCHKEIGISRSRWMTEREFFLESLNRSKSRGR